ncbi:MAG: hypothetical protein AAB526_02535 [Patescibacteria group bacterium]
MPEEKRNDIEDIFSSTEIHKESNIFKELEPKELPIEEEVPEVVKIIPKKNKKNILVVIGIILAIILVFIGVYVFFIKTRKINEIKKIFTNEKNTNVILTEMQTIEQSIDLDSDGLSDKEEAQFNTNSLKVDTDDDGLSDREEVKTWKTNPLNPDSDGDKIKDGDEIKQKTNPKGAGSLLETIH